MKITKTWLTLIALSALLILAACGNDNSGSNAGSSSASASAGAESPKPADSSTPSAHVDLTISAAASLTDALNEIKTAYEKAHSDTTLNFNFGASGALQQQIENGAPADLFLSAAEKNMKALVDGGLIDTGSETTLLKNELVLVAAKGGKASVTKAEDLTSPDVKKVAIGIPESVPAGSYAKEALTNAGLWDSLQSKLVQGKDVREVLQYVETGNADAGFVYKTDALTSDQVTVAAAVDPSSYTPITYPIGIVKATKHAEQSKAFFDYLQTPEAMAVFEKYGFTAAASK
ncbi:molybdate ABC transporter substrate-binding protein [Paenibacillus protaetiae]|uniref:Molybdate ABC transporter substrate-binding protein n=1 Tax=Paenibacillus protaetiae TaxID=2509456 RepID=A0A4P6EWY7_9BACL|nr:molybdate ABC transporter substrate-binding protein [Paenibacillus protaetiae]QAY67256.1 molybdate ABC transporter substrate-binding protein [Paenibacillus protaetiae]